MNLNSAITELKGVGEKRAKLYEKLGVKTVGDLLNTTREATLTSPAPSP